MSSNFKLFILTLGTFLLLLLSVNTKTYLLVFIASFAILFFYLRYDLVTTTFIIFTISLPFENNLREWTIPITSPLYASVPTSGYDLYFGISLKVIFGLLLFILMFRKNSPRFLLSLPDKVLLLFLAVSTINTYINFTPTSLAGYLRLWLSVLIYFSAKNFFKAIPNLFPIFVSAIFIFSLIISSNQLLRQKPMGKFIELTPGHSQDAGYSTTDGKSQYRVSGFISNPVYFGSFMSILLPIFIAYSFKLAPKTTSTLSLIGILGMLGTHSRTVWITITIIILSLKKTLWPLFRKIPYYRWLLTLFTLLSLFLIISRLPSITQLFTSTGNASIRLQLIWHSLVMMFNHPFGVGLHQFTRYLLDQPISSSLYGFIVPVHNTFFIIGTELGIIPLILFVVFIIRTIIDSVGIIKKQAIAHSALIAILTFLINSQFHPLLNLDPTFDIFMLTIGYLSSQCLPSRT